MDGMEGEGSCGWKDSEQGVRWNKRCKSFEFTKTPPLSSFVLFFRVARVQRELIIISRFDVRIERKRHDINEIRKTKNDRTLNFNSIFISSISFCPFFSAVSIHSFSFLFIFAHSPIYHRSINPTTREKHVIPFLCSRSSVSFLLFPILPSLIPPFLPIFHQRFIHSRDRTCRNCTFYSTINISRW